MRINWTRGIVAIVLAQVLSQTALCLFGSMVGIVVGVVGGALLGSLSQLPIWTRTNSDFKEQGRA